MENPNDLLKEAPKNETGIVFEDARYCRYYKQVTTCSSCMDRYLCSIRSNK